MIDVKKDPLEEYIRESEGTRREKGYAWQTAIGLQEVDGIKPSKYLIETAKKNINGEITFENVEQLLKSYYIENVSHDPDDRTEEADKVSARIASIISEKGFDFTVSQYVSIHKRLFDGIYKHAGKIRDYNISKKEWVLNGDTVTYGSAYNIKETLEYDIDRERKFDYFGLNQDEIISHISFFISNLWQIHAFSEGNTRTTAVFLIKYLRKLGYNVSNDAFAENAWYFRNALVRANYTNLALNIHETRTYLEKFLRNLLLNENNELLNREMHISNVFAPKQDIGPQKQDIGAIKTGHSQKNIDTLRKALAEKQYFGRTEVMQVLGITASPASELIKKMLEQKVITSVKGFGKGKYKF